MDFVKQCLLAYEQSWILSFKHLSQKRRGGRTTLKEVVVTPFFLFLFTGVLMLVANTITFPDASYVLHQLPSLSFDTSTDGIFNSDSPSNNDDYLGYVSQTRIYYSPNTNNGVNELMQWLADENPSISVIGMESPEAIKQSYIENLFNTWAAVEFNLDDHQQELGVLVVPGETNAVDYNIRISLMVSVLPDSPGVYEIYNDNSAAADSWSSSGYLTLQNSINTYLANVQTGNLDTANELNVETFLQRYPKSPYYEDSINFDMAVLRFYLWKWMAPTVATIALFTPMLGLLTQAVREKQHKMKDLLEISGLYGFSFYFSFLVVIVLLVQASIWVGCSLLVAMMTMTAGDFWAYVALMTCYTFALASSGFAFGHLVDMSEYYGLPIFIVNTGLAVGGDFIANDMVMPIGLKLFIGFFLPPMNFATGVFAIENYVYHNDNSMVPMDYQDLSKTLPSVNIVCLVMLFSSAFYLWLAWGYPFHWLFPSNTDQHEALATAARADIVPYHCDNQDEEEKAAQAAGSADATSFNFNRGRVLLDVTDVCQIYPDGTQAVKSMSFQVRDGEVLSYLGANGAGKSTTMNMLCGTLVPTFGDAVVNGYSITRDRTGARRNLGICMQQDIIWDDVSVEDHLFIFGRLRGTHGSKLVTDVERMLVSLGFPEKAKSLAGTLSGGQKRRLCVGLAMVGGNAVVFLDEPTAGLDPVSRRQLWELIQANRQGRAILLTTHFMDEADVLGDRIAIVKEGRLRALGSSKFLKNRFGLGYLLRSSLAQNTDINPIVQKIQQFVPSAQVVSAAGTELAVRMPKEAVSVFADMMEALENDGKSLGVLSFGIETTTLEEVFMRIVNEDTEMMLSDPKKAARMLGASKDERNAHEDEIREREEKRNPVDNEQLRLLLQKGRQQVKVSSADRVSMSRHTLSANDKDAGDADGWDVFMTQLRVLLWKRRHQLDRSRGQWAFSVLLPLGLIGFAAYILTQIPTNIIANDPAPIVVSPYEGYVSTPIAGATQQMAEDLASDANLGAYDTPTPYVGTDYEALYTYINDQSQMLAYGDNSVEGVFFESMDNFTVMYNASVPFQLPAMVTQLLDSAIDTATEGNLTITNECQQLPASAINDQANYSLLYMFIISLIMGSMGGGMSIVLSGERVGLVKHQQLASGTSKLTYWCANIIFDGTIMLLHLFVFMIAMACANSTDFSDNNAMDVLAAGLVFIFAALFRFYVVSFMVDDVRMVQSIFFYGSLLSMYAVCIFWLQIVFQVNQGNFAANFSQAMSFLCTIIDPVFGFGLFVLLKHNFLGAQSMHPGIEWNSVPAIFAAGVLMFIIFMMIEGGTDVQAFMTYLWLKTCGGTRTTDDGNTRTDPFEPETGNDDGMDLDEDTDSSRQSTVQRRKRLTGQLDPDILAEKERVREVDISKKLVKSEHTIFISELTKVFHGRGTVPTKVAVNNVSLAVGLGEVFGLLGANGAGKTTLLKIVSGLELPTSGKAYINGYNVVKNRTDAQRSMGLCPQFDTLVERLSVRENLWFFGMIKGIDQNLEEVAEAYMIALNIKKYENKLIQHLSGGNRRKVSLAVALMGCPPTVYLDEPSTGLDPVASRLMWRLLTRVATTKQTSIVLTTHNMLECEAVCTRIGVMKAGELVCLGDSQHLRSVHGTGFLLEVTVKSPLNVPAVKKFIETNFRGAEVVDEHSTMINYEVPANAISRLSVAFRLIEDNQHELSKLYSYELV